MQRTNVLLRRPGSRACLTLFVLLLGECPPAAASGDDYAAETAAWRAARISEVAGADGWLGLVGLYWLHEGDNVLGSGPAATVRLHHPNLDPVTGRFTLAGGTVSFRALGRRPVSRPGEEIRNIALASDVTGEPTVLAIGTLRFHVIERGRRFGVRVREMAESRRPVFAGLDYFDVDQTWVFSAKFERYEPSRTIPIVNVLGMDVPMRSPGALVFVRDGTEWRLDALQEHDDAKALFVMFSDGTSGHDTYGGGRFLSVTNPQQGHVLVDFNRAYNPPCAFTNFATCPLPPPQNRLSLPVTAGELRYGKPNH